MVLLFIALLSLLDVAYTQTPEIVDDILPEVKQQREIGYLNCTVVHTSVDNVIFWSKVSVPGSSSFATISRNEKIILDNNDDVGKQEDTGQPKYDIILTESRTGHRKTYTLVIRYLNEVDDGEYMCTIRLLHVPRDHWPNKKGRLVVQVPPKIKAGEISVYETEAGGSLTLQCDAYGKPSPNITWKREDGSYLPNGFSLSFGKYLRLENIQRNASGNYLCIADNSVRPPADYSVEVKVFFAPKVRYIQDTVGQAQNRRFNAKLECVVAGYPEPEVHWEKLEKGKRIILLDDNNFKTDRLLSTQDVFLEVWYILLVKNVAAEDYANYWCVASNTYGTGEVRFTLYETMECQGYNCPSLGAGASRLALQTTCFIVFVVCGLVFSFG